MQDWFAHQDAKQKAASATAPPAQADWFAQQASNPAAEPVPSHIDLSKLSPKELMRSGREGKEIWAELARRDRERAKSGSAWAPTILGAAGGMFAGIPGAAVGGAVGDAMRQAVLRGQEDPDAPQGVGNQLLSMGEEAAIQGGAQAAGQLFTGLARGLRRPPPSSVDQAAIDFGRSRGVPIDAATATRSPNIAHMQRSVSDNLGGAGVAENFQARQTQRLSEVGRDLAIQANRGGTAQTAESAGQRVVSGIERNITAAHGEADDAYTALRKLEQQSTAKPIATKPLSVDEMARYKTVGASPSGSDVRGIQLAVDLRPVKEGLKDLYSRLMRERELTGTLNGSKAKAAMALDTLMNAPEAAPLSVVDSALSDLKALARGADMPELRNAAQSTAAEAVKQLDAAVMRAARQGGDEVVNALQTGRKATVAKYIAADVRDALLTGTNGERVKVFNRLTGREDTAIGLLRSVKEQTPEAMADVGRAVLDDLVNTATQDGGFQNAGKLLAEWRKLGPETKALLYPDATYRANLDKFFTLAKIATENVNPSGSARTLNAAKLTMAIPSWIGAKLAYTPEGLQLLTQGLRVSQGTAQAAALTSQMLRLASAGRTGALAPAVASRDGATR